MLSASTKFVCASMKSPARRTWLPVAGGQPHIPSFALRVQPRAEASRQSPAPTRDCRARCCRPQTVVNGESLGRSAARRQQCSPGIRTGHWKQSLPDHRAVSSGTGRRRHHDEVLNIEGAQGASLPLAARPRHRSSGYCRNGRKNVRMSSASAAGCSIAAKWPPRGMTVQRRMSV